MSSHGPLGDWYRSHLGEPLEPDHVSGYWTFAVGALLATVGLVCFLAASTFERGASEFWLLRRIAFTLALVAGPVVVLGVVYLLPLQERAVHVALAGLALCLVAAIAFNVFYPDGWNWGAADRSAVVMAGYGLGIGIQLLAALVYPVVAEETAQPAAAPERSAATFQLYRDRGGEHRWRLVHDNGNVIADGGEGYASRQTARQGMESVQRNAPGATVETLESPPSAVEGGGVAGSGETEAEPETEAEAEAAAEPGEVDSAMEDLWDGEPDEADPEETETTNEPDAGDEGDDEAVGEDDEVGAEADDADGEAADDAGDEDDTGAFEFGVIQEREAGATLELYEDAAGEWRWRLRHRNGAVIADSGEGYANRSRAEEAIERLQSVAGEADALDYDPAAFELYADRASEWRWRLRGGNGRVLADSGEGYATRRNARNAIEGVRHRSADPDAFEVYEDAAGEYRWRLAASDGEVVADSGQGYARESSAAEAVERIARVAPEADALDYDPAAYELYEDRAGEWRWRLRHRSGTVIADSGEGYASRGNARRGIRSVTTSCPDARVRALES